MTDAKHTILIAGSADDAGELTARLHELGHVVCADVRSGREAVAAADELRPDLALVDLALDGPVSGAEAAARIGSDCDVPVICVVGDDADANRLQEAREAEPAGYLVKPYAVLQLRLSIDAARCAHRRETKFRDRSLLMESALQSASEGIVVTDQDREYVFVNVRAEEIMGTVITETDPDRWHGVFGVYRLDGTTPYPIDELPIMRAHGGHASDDLEMLIRNESRPEGVYVSASGRPLTRPDGEVTGAVIVFHDITRLKTVESELRTTVEDLRRQVSLTETVFDSISDSLIVTDSAGDITAWNSAAERIIGTPSERSLERRSEAYGLYYSDGVTMVPPHELPTGRAIRGESTDWVDIFIRNEAKPDGVHTSVSGRPLYDRSGALTGSVIVIRDVTRIRETESKLRKTTAQLQAQNDTMETIFNSISDGVVVADQDGRFMMFNPSAERIVGVGATDTTPDQWPDRYGIFFADKVTRVPTDELPLMRAISGDSVEQMDLFIRNERIPDGAFISVSGRPMRDRSGNATGGVAVFRDVTRQTEADHALMEAFSQGRLEVVDTILHNIGNAITSVSIGMGTIDDDLRNNKELSRFLALADAIEAHRDDWTAYVTADPQGRQVLPFVLALASDFRSQNERLTRSVERIAGRVSHIVDIIRTQKSFQDGAMARKVVNVRNAVMDSVKVLAESLSSRNVEIAVDTDKAPAEIWIQESRLHQMLVNLVKNALEAIDEHAASAPSGLDRPVIRIDCYREREFLVIDVADNGIGIDDVRNHRIFSAGYTTKEGGSGLGLHSAANFVIGSGGRITALSDGIGTGATMRVMLRYSPVPEHHA